jgi:hypothetical protein
MAAMKLSDLPGKREARRHSKVDRLDQSIIDQLVAARKNDTHSVNQMVAWLNEHCGVTNVTASGLAQWFAREGLTTTGRANG